ncbi:MAG: transglycosylase domain-containing protein, partial [Leptospiraceae bacterium]|nr:transglycosylase domain-containing protein [Leptospiraceae bacterium]
RTSEFRPQETREQQPFFEKDSRVSSRESYAKDKLDFHSSKDSGRKKNKISSGNFQKQNNEFIFHDLFRKKSFYLSVTALFFILLGIPLLGAFLVPKSELTARIPVNGLREANLIVDRNGDTVAELIKSPTGNLSPEQIPGNFSKLLTFVEDRSFFEHNGIHLSSTFRAMLRNLLSFRFAQGGSTITQQTSRILLSRREKTLSRKALELRFAFILEERFNKKEILTLYSNLVYLGHGATGFQRAANFYFNKNLSDLNFVENLVLVCLPSAPEKFSPIRNRSSLSAKMQNVYEELQDEKPVSLEIPSRSEYEILKNKVFAEFSLRSPSESVFGERLDHAPWVSELVRVFIEENLGPEYVYDSGLKISTTLDLSMQLTAVKTLDTKPRLLTRGHPPVLYRNGKYVGNAFKESEFKSRVREIEPLLSVMGFEHLLSDELSLQAAGVGIDVTSGAIRFLHGGSEFNSSNQLNRVLHMYRQTGSAIKPFVYATAIETGALTPATPVLDAPLYTRTSSSFWLPENIAGSYAGEIPARRALAESRNTPAIRVLRMAGIEPVQKIFKALFYHDQEAFQKRFRSDDTIAIGSLEMSPLEMAIAFSLFGNNGRILPPFLITEISDRDGNILYSLNSDENNEKQSKIFPKTVSQMKTIFSGGTVSVMRSMLKDTGRAARHGQSNVIGKTGTSNDYRDMWFVGERNGISSAIWVGYDNPKYSVAGGSGSGIAAPLWGSIMATAPTGGKIISPEPSGVTKKVCRLSGKIARAGCRDVVSEIFKPDFIPQQKCPEHTDSKEGGSLAIVPTRNNDFE